MDTFDYSPLFELLSNLGLSLEDFRKRCKLAESTVYKISIGKPIMISSICKICILLGVELSDVIAINYQWQPKDSSVKSNSDLQSDSI